MNQPPSRSQPPEDLAARKAIAGAFDGLVRSVLLGTSKAPEAAERLARTWLKDDHIVLHLEAVALTSGNVPVLQADEETGRWILPAFMAGLRTIAPRSDLRGADLLALAEGLGGLVPEQGALERFRLWLWSDGVEGLATELTTGFAELLETSKLDVEQRANEIKQERSKLSQDVTQARVSRMDLQKMRQSGALQRGTQALVQAGAAASNPSLPGLKALAEGCEDESYWARQEVALAFAMPDMRGNLPANTMARQMARAARDNVDARLLAMLSALMGQTDAFASRLITCLGDANLGGIIADKAALDASSIPRLAAVAAGSDVIAGQLVDGLVARAVADDNSAEEALVAIGSQLGADALFGHIQTRDMPTATRKVVTRLAARTPGGGKQLVALFDKVGQQEAVELLPSVPTALLPKIHGRLKDLLEAGNPKQRTALAAAIMQTCGSPGAGLLGRTLAASKLRGWEPTALRAVADHCVAKRAAVDALAAAVHDQDVAGGLRVMLLDKLATDKKAADVVLQRSLKELMYPPELKQRLAHWRKGGGR